MRHKGTERVLGIEAALRDLLRDVLRDELRHLREEMLAAFRAHEQPPPANEPSPDELLTVDQVAQALKVIPDTVRDWIRSGRSQGQSAGQRYAPRPQVPCSPGGPGRIRRVFGGPARAARWPGGLVAWSRLISADTFRYVSLRRRSDA